MPVGNFKSGFQTVASAGTAESLVATNTYVHGVTIRARSANTGNAFVGDSTVDSATDAPLTPGDVVSVSHPRVEFNLADVFVDVAVSGETVDFWYLER
jgi:hypothetical protein